MKIKDLAILGVRISILTLIYSGIRLAFYLANSEIYVNQTSAEILNAFVHGIRFDLAALFWINAPLFVLLLIKHKIVRTERVLFLALNFIFLIAGGADVILFPFNGKRMSREFFTSIQKDIQDQIVQLTLYYWYVPFAVALVGVLVYRLDKILERLPINKVLSMKRWAIPAYVLTLGFVFVGIRGGLQDRSVNIIAAFTDGAPEIGHLTLNTPFHFLRTFNLPRVEKRTWFTPEELESRLLSLRQKAQYPGKSGHNVVLILLESFSLEYFEQGHTPFLNELGKKGLFFSRNFANGRRSIEVLSSVFDGVPSIQDIPFSRSSPQAMPILGLPRRLKEAGYGTSFFHGSHYSSMGFRNYALARGVDEYFSREEYPGPSSDFDSHWGIYDGAFLKFFLSKIKTYKEPFFTGIFTLSSHHPFVLPPEYRNKFPKTELDIHPVIRYTDEMLREFFEAAAKEPFFNNTLFVITADHTHQMIGKKFNNSLGNYRVPLIIYHPQVQFDSKLAQKVTQHIDIPATVLDFLDIPAKGIVCGGESVFAPGRGRAFHYLQPGWQFVAGDRGIFWQENAKPDYFIWNDATGETQTAAKHESSDEFTEFQLLNQYYFEGFVDHAWPFVCAE